MKNCFHFSVFNNSSFAFVTLFSMWDIDQLKPLSATMVSDDAVDRRKLGVNIEP